MPNQPPLAPGVEVCPECEKGFPIEEGEHYGTQSLGMIPTTRCRALPPAPEQKPCELCCGHDAQKFSDGSCAMRVGLGFCRHRCPAAPEPAPQPPCDCAIRADGIGAMHGHHDEQCPRYAAPQPASEVMQRLCAEINETDISATLFESGIAILHFEGEDFEVREVSRTAGEQARLAQEAEHTRSVLRSAIYESQLKTRLKEMMRIYESRIRSLCTPEQLEQKPWRVAEYVLAEEIINAPRPAAPPHDWARVAAEKIAALVDRVQPLPFASGLLEKEITAIITEAFQGAATAPAQQEKEK